MNTLNYGKYKNGYMNFRAEHLLKAKTQGDIIAIAK
ncbi:MAG: hypothetical protein ACJATI_004404 [Halioglobus sp.]